VIAVVVLAFMDRWAPILNISKFTSFRWNLEYWQARHDSGCDLNQYCPGPRTGYGKHIRDIQYGFWSATPRLGSDITGKEAKADGFTVGAVPEMIEFFVNSGRRVDGKKVTREMFNEHTWAKVKWTIPKPIDSEWRETHVEVRNKARKN